MRKFFAGAAVASVAVLSGCGLFEGDSGGPVQGDTTPSQLTDASGESIDAGSEVPSIEGLDLVEPEDAMGAEVQLCNAGKHWLQSGTSKEDRESLAPWMLYVANEYQEETPDVAGASKVLIQMGTEVSEELNRGQDNFRRTCGISVNELG